jgi:hypothetical protein
VAGLPRDLLDFSINMKQKHSQVSEKVLGLWRHVMKDHRSSSGLAALWRPEREKSERMIERAELRPPMCIFRTGVRFCVSDCGFGDRCRPLTVTMSQYYLDIGCENEIDRFLEDFECLSHM